MLLEKQMIRTLLALTAFQVCKSEKKFMGVNKLWSLLEPTSKAVLMESIAGSKLAVDASIWLYQFLKAMRDSDGNPIRGAHIVGFLRRICKLLFYGIKPIFVFDGETPTLKLATLQARNQRKQRAGDNLERTANKLLQAQMKLAAIDQVNKYWITLSSGLFSIRH